LKEQWCIPAKENAAFVCSMEDVLDVYTRPYDPKRPQVCMDETNKQLTADIRAPQAAQPGKPKRVDYEYKRQGVANLFMFFEPLGGGGMSKSRIIAPVKTGLRSCESCRIFGILTLKRLWL
jgi:hypothetical protein